MNRKNREGTAPTPATPARAGDPVSAGSREEGSGTVLALGIVAVLLIMTVTVAGLIGVVSASRRASSAADLSALAAADAYRGLAPGDPCEVAEEWAVKNGARLEACIFPDRPETVEVTVAVPVSGPMSVLGPARARARAGSAHPLGERAPEAPEVGDPPEEIPAEEAPPTD